MSNLFNMFNSTRRSGDVASDPIDFLSFCPNLVDVLDRVGDGDIGNLRFVNRRINDVINGNRKLCHRIRLDRCQRTLVHACQCCDAKCGRMSCHKMRRVIQHTHMCKKRDSPSCSICKELIALCCYHAKQCNEDSCTFPSCKSIHQKWAKAKEEAAKKKEEEAAKKKEEEAAKAAEAAPDNDDLPPS